MLQSRSNETNAKHRTSHAENVVFLGKRTSKIILRGRMVLYYRFRQDFFFTSKIKLIFGP